jgi:protein phosphatase
MTAHALECEPRTHIGLVRGTNQDYLDCFPEQGVFLLADGMGGHRAGETASRVAVEAAATALLNARERGAADDTEGMLRVGQAVEASNHAVRAAVERDPALAGMGTTLVLGIRVESHLFFAHVGDSRLYRLRDGELARLTRDHSLVQELLDKGLFGDRAEAHAAGIGDNILTRGIGLEPEVEVDVGHVGLHADDIYLACSDGLTGGLTDREIGEIMLGNPELGQMADALLTAALEAGGRDNISLILVRPRF